MAQIQIKTIYSIVKDLCIDVDKPVFVKKNQNGNIIIHEFTGLVIVDFYK